MADTVLEQIAALKDEDWGVREDAATALGEARDSRAVLPLVAVLKDPDRAVRQAAITALTAIGEASVLTLGGCLKDSDLTLQESAASILSTIADCRVIAPLLDALASPDWIVRMDAAKALGRIGDPQAVEPLLSLLQDKVKAVREEASTALARVGEAALPSLVASLTHGEWMVRLHTVEALGKLKSAAAADSLLSVVFNDRDSAVRVDAVRSLGEIGGARAVEFLITAMQDRELRPAAIEALGKIADRRAVPALVGVLTGANRPPSTRPIHGCGDRYQEEEMVAMGAAAKALALIKDETTMRPLVAALQNTVVREEAAAALVAFGPPAIPLLLGALGKEKDENIVYHVKESLRQLGWRPNRMDARAMGRAR